MNNDVYNNKGTSSLDEAYARLNEAIKRRNASANNQQYDTTNGVALNTTPISNSTQENNSDSNWLTRTAGTVSEAVYNVKQGFLKLGEGVFDAHVAIGSIFDKQWAEETIKYDITQTVLDWTDNNLSINALYKGSTGENLRDQSWLNDASDKVQNIVTGVEQGIGNALGFALLSKAPYGIGIGLTWSGSSGMVLEESLNNPEYNGNFNGAWGNAFLVGGVETGLEYLMGWSPKKAGVSSKTFKSIAKELGKNFVEEGAEEVASDLVTPFFEGMYTDKTLKDSYDDVTLESLGETFLVGGITGLIMTGGQEIINTTYLSSEGSKIAHEINENEEYYKQAYEDFKNNPNEVEAFEKFEKVREEVTENLKVLGERVGKLASKYQNRLGNNIKINGETVNIQTALGTQENYVKNTDPRVKAVQETLDLINKSKVENLQNLDIEFVSEGTEAYEQAFKTKEKGINGAFDRKNNKLYLNTNSQKAFKFIIGHEITHPMENMKENSAYKAIYDEIIASLRKSGQYQKQYNSIKKRYKNELKNKSKQDAEQYINQEIVADYMGENFKNFAEIQKLFTKQSTWEKFKDLIKKLRKENNSSKAKEYYQRFLKESYGTKIEEKKQPTQAVAYSKKEDNDIKYSKVETTPNEVAQTSKLIEKEIEKARDFVKENKNYPDSDIRSITNALSQEIKNINHTTASDLAKDARTVLSSFDGDKFLTNEKLKDTITPEQQLYFKEAFAYLKSRISLEKNGKPVKLDYKTKINNSNYSLLEGKTEGQVVLDTLRTIKKVLRTSSTNIVKINNKEIDRKLATQEEIERQQANNRIDQKPQFGVVKAIKQGFTSILDGSSYFDVLGNADPNSLLNDIYGELYIAQIENFKTKRDFQEDINTFVNDKANKSLIKKLKDNKSKVEITQGKSIFYGQAVSLYMALNSEQTPQHLFHAERGGTVFKDEKGRSIKISRNDFINMLSESSKQEILSKDFKKKSSAEKKKAYRKYADEIRTILKSKIGNDADELISKLAKKYSDSSKLYKKVAEETLGFSYTIQDNYYPVKSDVTTFASQSGTIDTTGNYMNDVMNPSFTKKLSPNASNQIVISDVLDTYLHFSNQLAVWSQISTRVKNIDRILNTTIDKSGKKFRAYLNEYVDPNFTKRYESLVLAMQGINKNEVTDFDRLLNKIRGINASVSLSYNAKTIAIQPTAYFKFLIYVKPKNWLKALGKTSGLMSFKELVNSSALVYDRYYGNGGRNIAEAQTVGAAKSINKFGEFGMKGITLFDRIPLLYGWRAIQLEAQEKGITDKAEIVRMFEKAVYETQATYDPLSNGSVVRVNNELLKSAFMYSSENRKTLSRFFHSIYVLRKNPKSKKAWVEFAGSTTSMIAGAAVIAAISSFLKHLKGDDEEEKWVETFGDEFAANLVGNFPVVSNLYNSLVNGFDPQLTGFSQITDLLDLPKYCEQLMETNATEAQKTSAIMQIAQRLAHFVGIPFRNLYNDLLYLAGVGDFALDTNMVMKLRNIYYNTDNRTTSTLIKTYNKRNDMEKLSAMIQIKNEKFGAGKTNEKVANEMARLYNKGALDTFPSELKDTYSYEGQEVKMSKTQYKQAKDIYSLANESMELMLASSQYSGLTDEEKAQAIKKLYGAYYEASKTSVLEASAGTKFSKVVKYIDSGKFASYLAKIDGLKASTTSGSKKEVVQAYINRTGLTKNEKYLLAHLAGYSISDEAKVSVINYLRSKGMNYKTANSYFA